MSFVGKGNTRGVRCCGAAAVLSGASCVGLGTVGSTPRYSCVVLPTTKADITGAARWSDGLGVRVTGKRGPMRPAPQTQLLCSLRRQVVLDAPLVPSEQAPQTMQHVRALRSYRYGELCHVEAGERRRATICLVVESLEADWSATRVVVMMISSRR